MRFIESWRGTFEDYINKGDELLNFSFDEIKAYCKTLQFDGAMHEIKAPYVQAWKIRHVYLNKEYENFREKFNKSN